MNKKNHKNVFENVIKDHISLFSEDIENDPEQAYLRLERLREIVDIYHININF